MDAFFAIFLKKVKIFYKSAILSQKTGKNRTQNSEDRTQNVVCLLVWVKCLDFDFYSSWLLVFIRG